MDARVLLSNPASHQQLIANFPSQLIFDLLLLSFIRRTQLIITADPTHRRRRTLLSSSTSVHLYQCNEKISNLLHNKDERSQSKQRYEIFFKKQEIFRFRFNPNAQQGATLLLTAHLTSDLSCTFLISLWSKSLSKSRQLNVLKQDFSN